VNILNQSRMAQTLQRLILMSLGKTAQNGLK
jgi:hypothetical protein